MAERFLEFLSNLLKIGKEQLLEKGGFLRNKVPIKPVLGLTGLGVLFMAVRPLFTNSNLSQQQQQQQQSAIQSTIHSNNKPEQQQQQQLDEKDDVKKTLYLMRQKEKELKKQQEQLRQKM